MLNFRRLGVTKLHTRRQSLAWKLLLVLGVVSVVAGWWATLTVWAWWTGVPGPRAEFQSPTTTGMLRPDNEFRFPLKFDLPPIDPWSVVPLIAGVVVAVYWLVLRPLTRMMNRDPRLKAFPSRLRVRRNYGAFRARLDSKFTLPGMPWWYRWTLPTSALGFSIGSATTPRLRRLWLSFDRRVRIVGYSGWGKTSRLLVPIVRGLPGAALVSSTEPDIFLSTVKARETRWWNGRPRRLPKRVKANPFTSRPTRWVRPRPDQFPVHVVDCLPQQGRVTGGYPSVTWNPIPGCEDYTVALIRAEALVKGLDAEAGESGGDGTSRWFEGVCTEVFAAWFHAAAFDPTVEIADIAKWLNDSDIQPCEDILRMFPAAEPAAITNLRKHLNPKGGRTTANVETLLARAMQSLQSSFGQVIIGSRGNPGQFDIEQLIHDRGTLYLLANPKLMVLLRPLLSLIAGEVCRVAEDVALTKKSRVKRLDSPFYAVLDELRYGVRVAALPYISNTNRKFGVHYITTAIDNSDEIDMYGENGARKLRTNAVSIYASPDVDTMQEITELAGKGDVVTAHHGENTSDSIDRLDILTAADAANLDHGDMIVVSKTCRPIIGHVKSVWEQRGVRRRIAREAAQVTG